METDTQIIESWSPDTLMLGSVCRITSERSYSCEALTNWRPADVDTQGKPALDDLSRTNIPEWQYASRPTVLLSPA